MHKKFFVSFVFLILLLSSILGFYSIRICEKYYIEQYMEHLAKETKMLSIIFTNDLNQEEGIKNIEQLSHQYAENFGYRITIMDETGRVLADSQAIAQKMENHKDREEIKEALAGEIGISIRYSHSLKTYFIYSAIGISVENQNMIIRTAVPLIKLDSIKNQVIIYILSGLISATFFVFILAYYIVGKMTKPLDHLTNAAEEISRGNYGKKIPIDSNDQIGLLTKAFNRMSQKLHATVDQLEEENSKLESIVNSMMNGLIAVNLDNKIMMINDESYHLFHIKINDIIGYNFYDIIRNEEVCDSFEKAVKKQGHVINEFVLKEPLEGDKIIRIHVNPIIRKNSDKKHMGTLFVFQDVTQIRKLEMLRSDFVSNVTHELKTPLTSILGFTDTLKAGAIHNTDTAMRFIDIIDIEAKRLFRLIQDILSLSEMETRNEDTNVVENDVLKILENVRNILNPAAEEKGIQLIFDLSQDIPLFVCNKDRITQMLINLIDNAIKYTEQGKVIVFCRKKGDNLEFIVQDTGIGIPKENQIRIFERFYRVDKGRSRKAGGTGLGLSIVKHIVMLYEGNIYLESEEGKGSSFMIHLPFKKKTREK